MNIFELPKKLSATSTRAPCSPSAAGKIKLYRGDCLDVLKRLPSGTVDAVVTDPPYGVGFDGKRGRYRNRPDFKRTDTYASYDDTAENWFSTIYPALEACTRRFKTAAFFMGSSRILDMPKGGELGGIFLPNGCGRGRWGFQNFMHVVFYGKCPYLARGMGSRPNGKYGCYGNDSNKINHPCAKPIAAMKWLVERATMPGETVVDPFMGSGTTGVACVETGRNFIGIEIDPDYYAIAKRRIAAARRQKATV